MVVHLSLGMIKTVTDTKKFIPVHQWTTACRSCEPHPGPQSVLLLPQEDPTSPRSTGPVSRKRKYVTIMVNYISTGLSKWFTCLIFKLYLVDGQDKEMLRTSRIQSAKYVLSLLATWPNNNCLNVVMAINSHKTVLFMSFAVCDCGVNANYFGS